MLHASRGCPAFVSIGVNRCARRAGSFHWTFVIEHSLSIGVEKRGEPCRQRCTRSIEEGRSLGVPALAQRFATFRRVACGCTYPSSAWLKFGYPAAIRQTRCIRREASFLIRRSNNSAGRLARGSRRAPERSACHGLRRVPAPGAPGRTKTDGRAGGASRTSRARRSGRPCPTSVTELGFLAYESGREARRPKGQRGRMSFSEAPAARPENPERLPQARLSNLAHLATARPPRSPSSSLAV